MAAREELLNVISGGTAVAGSRQNLLQQIAGGFEPIDRERQARIARYEEEQKVYDKEAGKSVFRRFFEELPGSIKKVGADILRAPGRAAASLDLSARGVREFTPETKLEKFVLGEEPIKSIGVRKQEAEETLKGFGLSEEQAKPLATVGVIGLTALDLYPGSAGKGKLVSQLAKETSEATIKALLKKNVKNLTDDAIERLAPTISKLSKADEVEKIIAREITSPQQAVRAIDVSRYGEPSQRTARAFQQSTDQTPIPTRVSKEIGDIAIGSFGRNAIARKATQVDRFPVDEIGKTIDNSFLAIPASKNPKSWRSDNIVFISKSDKGLRAVYTRPNERGVLEVINAHSIPDKNVPKYFEDIGQSSISARTRTGMTSLEDSQFIRLAYGDNLSLSEQVTRVKQGVDSGMAAGVERGFISSAKEVVPTEKIAGQYIPRSTDELAIKAKNLIADDLAAAEKMALTRSDDNAVAVASELLKKYADDAAKATDQATANALYERAAEVANTLAPKLTEQGRAIQAASILGRLTPEGQVRFAAREIMRHNETALKKIPDLTGEQAGHILKEMSEINTMADGVEKAMRFQKLQNYIQDLVPTPLIKKITTVWKAGLLTGAKTQGLNIFSNLFHGTTEAIKQVPAAIVDSAASLFTGARTTTATLRGTKQGISEGFEKGVRYFKTGFDERNIGAKLDYHRVNFGKGPVAEAFQTYTQTVFRFLGAQDQPFYYGALSRSLYDQALAQGKNAGLKGRELVKFADNLVQNPTEEMIRYGTLDATTAVFQNKTKLGEAARAIQKIPGVGEFLLPFGRTPSAVAMQIVNYSPVGIVKTIVQNIGKGKFDQRLFSQGIGRGLTGTAIAFIGLELAKKGMIALEYPFGDKREQDLQKAEGVKNNAILIGGKWRSPIVLGPAGNLILMGGHIQRALEESGSASEAFSKAAFGTFDSFLDQTFVTGLRSAINAITDPETYAKTYLPNLAASFVPTVVSDVARATDPLERRPETTVERIQARVPGARLGLEPQVDILGRERERVGNPLEVLIDPTRPSPQTDTPITQELRRLMDAGERVSPTALGDRKGFKALTQSQNTELWKRAGQITNDKLESLFSKPEYQELPDDQKGKIVDDVVSKSKVVARAEKALELTEGLSGEALKKRLSELKEGGLLTREVFNLYGQLR